MSPALVSVGWEGWTQPSLEAVSVGAVRGTGLGVDWAGQLTWENWLPEECPGDLLPSVVTCVLSTCWGGMGAQSTKQPWGLWAFIYVAFRPAGRGVQRHGQGCISAWSRGSDDGEGCWRGPHLPELVSGWGGWLSRARKHGAPWGGCR